MRELIPLQRFREDLAASGLESGTKGREVEPFLAWAETRDGEPNVSLLLVGRVLVGVTLPACSSPRKSLAPTVLGPRSTFG